MSHKRQTCARWGYSRWQRVARCTLNIARCSCCCCCCLHTADNNGHNALTHSHTHEETSHIDWQHAQTRREKERGSEGQQQSLDSWPWLDRWFVSVQVIHEFRWTPINNHIRPVPPSSPCLWPLWPCWQHEKWPMAAKMEESSRFSFAFSQVCGAGSRCRCVHTYLCICNSFFQRLLLLFLSLVLSAASHSFVAATLIYLTVPGFDILTQITADQADSLHPPSWAL